MNSLTFSNNDSIPQLGLGTWLSKPKEVYNAVIEALKAGYRHFDCAYIYKNEREIGEALQYAFNSGLVKREDLFITSKLWNNFHHPDDVEKAARISLKNLRLEYLDLYLIHWPIAFRTEQPDTAGDLIPLDELPLEKTWDAMVMLKKKGLARHIGVSNFNMPKLGKLLLTGVKPEVNQIEIHPYFQQDELLRFCHEHDILVTAYSPLGSRHLMRAEDTITATPTVISIAEKHNCTPAQVILAWGMKRGAAVIPKSVNPDRIRENLDSINIQLDDDDMAAMAKLNRDARNAKALFAILPEGTYTYQSIWEE